MILISVKPKYADMILSGEKTVELRRNDFPWSVGALFRSPIYVYSTAPVSAIVGFCDLLDAKSFVCCSEFPGSGVRELLQYLGSEKLVGETGLSIQEIRDYLKGSPKYATALRLQNATAFHAALKLFDLRHLPASFYPPVSFRRMTAAEIEFVGNHTVRGNGLTKFCGIISNKSVPEKMYTLEGRGVNVGPRGAVHDVPLYRTSRDAALDAPTGAEIFEVELPVHGRCYVLGIGSNSESGVSLRVYR